MGKLARDNVTRHRLNVVLLAALAIHVPSGLAAQGGPPGFYERKAEGWFWYAPEPKKEQPEPKAASEKPVVQPLPQEAPTTKAKTAGEGPQPFSAVWFRKNLPKYKDAAWDNPTVENLRAFLYLQRFAIDRSQQFSDAAELAVVGDPFLDEITRRPAATFASQKVDREAGAAKNQLIKEVAQRVGIFFFFKSDCPYCELQAPLIKTLERTEDFTIVPVSVDGEPLPGRQFSNYKVDDGHAERLGVQNYPAVFLASPDGQFASIGQGAMSLPELNHRILVAARRNNWVTEEEFNRTRPVLDLDSNVAEMLASPDMAEELEALSRTEGSEDEYIPPEKLMEYIRANLQEK